MNFDRIGGRAWQALVCLTCLVAFVVQASGQGAWAGTAADGRAQLHRNGNRGVPYLPLATHGGETGEPTLRMAAWKTIELDGRPLPNVYANLLPIDVDGDGAYEFVHFNGFRFMQVWSQSGAKLWRAGKSDGRLHDYAAGTHRDTAAVLDADGDGGQDIAHCWNMGGQRVLVLRRGSTGKPIRSVLLPGTVLQDCQIAAFRMAGTGQVQILVAQRLTGAAAAACRYNFLASWSRVVAYDLSLRKLWQRDTCDAGHYVWPLDENYDGLAEAVFVGKYLIRPDGSLRCSLAGWPATDHVDSLAVADVDPSRPGVEAAAVGRTGTGLFDVATCAAIWRIPTTVIRDPQHVVAAKIDPTSPTPMLLIDERGSETAERTFVLNGQGHIVSVVPKGMMPMQNANLDGATGVDEAVSGFGAVVDHLGRTRLTKYWYWYLKGSRVIESTAGLYPRDYDRWQAFPLVFDVDRDGRDEIVQWGQSLIVIGKVR